MNSLQNIDINAINAISSAVTVMQRTNRPFNAEENRNLIDELTLNCPALDLEDLDSMIDWEDASDDLKVFKLILEGALNTFMTSDSSAFQICGTYDPVDKDHNGCDIFEVQMVFKHCGDTLVVKNTFTQVHDIMKGWECERNSAPSYRLNGKTLDVDDIISDDFNELASKLILDKSYPELPNQDEVAPAAELLDKNKALVALLPTITL
ncbi:hypothetical protein WE348_21700 (plasmid) [Alteromonas macleodii]|uniref:hypothetical protein n=1 Tax=Alteromonas macleodii TaxID=28108 RepID=UPI0030CEF159